MYRKQLALVGLALVLVLVGLASLACEPGRPDANPEVAGSPESDYPSADLTEVESDLSVTFTYSILNVDDVPAVATALEQFSVPETTTYALWTPRDLADATPFAGLLPNQLAFMLAWQDDTDAEAVLSERLSAIDGIRDFDTTTYESVYLSDELRVPTAEGFYVHRDEWYRPEDVARAVQLSKEAWTTFEPTFGVRITGLFRERPDAPRAGPAIVASLLRIVWYPSEAAWLDSRNFQRDPASQRRFAERRTIQVEGSGIALATNRAMPVPGPGN